MRRSVAHAVAVVYMLPMAAFGNDELTEEIVVTASFTDATDALTRPVHVLSGEDLASNGCLLYTSPSPRDRSLSRMPSSA